MKTNQGNIIRDRMKLLYKTFFNIFTRNAKQNKIILRFNYTFFIVKSIVVFKRYKNYIIS